MYNFTNENKTVYYNIRDKKVNKDAKQIEYQKDEDYMTLERKEIVWKKFPISHGAPNWALSLLFESNNLRHTEDNIRYFNCGGENIIIREDEEMQQ